MRYLPEIDEAITALCRDHEITLKGKLILLGIISDHVTAISSILEEELPASGLIQ